MRSETPRLFELASQLHTGSEELLALAHTLGLPVKSKMSKLSQDQVAALREAREQGFPGLPQSSQGFFQVAEEQAQNAAIKGEAAEQAKELAWTAKIEKIRAELQASSQEKELPALSPPLEKGLSSQD
jgi:Translation initiation factor IF-2, N-terminal region